MYLTPKTSNTPSHTVLPRSNTSFTRPSTRYPFLAQFLASLHVRVDVVNREICILAFCGLANKKADSFFFQKSVSADDVMLW